MGRRVEQAMEVTEFEPNHSFAIRGASGLLNLNNRYTFQLKAGGTRVKVTSEMEISGMLSLAAPAIAAMGKKQIAADHENLKRLLAGYCSLRAGPLNWGQQFTVGDDV